MPTLAQMHPYVAHIVIGFLVAGVSLRLLSTTGKLTWTNPAAALLIILGAAAAVVGEKSGTAAHGPVEAIPGVRTAVQEHEEWGKRTRNLFLIIAGVELAALALASKQRAIRMVSAALGLGGLFAIYETGEHGGALVYSYAGGVGTRMGAPEDVNRLLLAGMYNQALLDRKNGHADSAAALFAEMGKRWPADMDIRMLGLDSRLRDSHDALGTLAAVDSIKSSVTDPRLKRRLTMIRVYALLGADRKDSARMELEQLAKDNPTVARYKTLLDSIK